jgi:hypothetical protein
VNAVLPPLDPIDFGVFRAPLAQPRWRNVPEHARACWVYFIQGDDGGPVKIGRARDLFARLPKVQIGYPFGTLRYVGLLRGVGTTEWSLHQRFAHLRLRGEWFRPEPELLDFIRSLPRECR